MNKLLASLGLLCCAAQGAMGATTVTKTSGTGLVSGVTIATTATGQSIRFTAAATGSITVVVEVDTPTEIELIEVEANKQSTAIGQVQLICRAKPGTAGRLQRVGSIRPISLDGTADGELIIENVTTDLGGLGGGNIGARGTTRGGEVRAPIISTLNCAGNLTANVVASGRVGGTQSNVNFVNVLNTGSLYGDIRANQGVIGMVTVMGDIGPAVGSGITQPSLVARDGIRKIRCRDFNGTMSTVQNGAVGNVQRIDTTGNFAGTLTTTNLAVVDVAQVEKGILIGGNMSGTMTFSAGLISTLTVNGAMSGTLDVGSVASDRPASDPLRDTDVTFGTFPASGRFICRASVAGPIAIGGPLAGNITIGSVGTPGHLYAALTATSMTGLVEIHGSVQLTRSIALTGALMPEGRIFVGQSLLGSISLPAGGLLGQIIVNGDMPTPAGTWSGTVTVGSVLMAAPVNGEYAPLAGELGGGVLATSPFRLHRVACSPVHDSSTPIVTSQFSGAASPTIMIRSYGPMEKAPGVLGWIDSVRIEREEPAGSCTWVDAESAFDLTMVDEVDGRELAISSAGTGLPVPGTYRVVPTGLRSRGIAGSPAVVWPSSCGANAPQGAYVFRIALDCDGDGQPDAPGSGGGDDGVIPVGNTIPDGNSNGIPDDCEQLTPPACSCDANGDHVVTADDIFAFLDQWFALEPPADFNQTDGITADDIFAFLDCWFNSQGPCPQ